MKKVILVLAVGAFLASCGKSACDCKKESEELGKKALKGEDVKDDLEALKEDCKDYKKEDYKDCD